MFIKVSTTYSVELNLMSSVKTMPKHWNLSDIVSKIGRDNTKNWYFSRFGDDSH